MTISHRAPRRGPGLGLSALHEWEILLFDSKAKVLPSRAMVIAGGGGCGIVGEYARSVIGP